MLARLICFLLDHVWRHAGTGLPGGVMEGLPYSRCARCDADSREWWEIEDDTLCRLERVARRIQERS